MNTGQFIKGHKNWNDKRIISLCPICHNDFTTTTGVSGHIFCSHKCYWKSLRGKKPMYSFPKGIPSWSKGKKRLEITGENHPLWKGNAVSYTNLHVWVRRHKGKPIICAICGGMAQEWANKSRKYKRRLDDWIALCKKCHRLADVRKTSLH